MYKRKGKKRKEKEKIIKNTLLEVEKKMKQVEQIKNKIT